MNPLALATSILVLFGAFFMAAAILQGRKIGGHVPPELQRRWRIMVVFMLFFLAGYLLLVVILTSRLTLPTELVTGPVFFGGAVFVFIVISLTRDTIGRIRSAGEELRLLNESLERRVVERTQELQGSHEFLRTVLDSLNDSVIIIDVNDFRIRGTNAAFQAEYGLTEKEIIGKTCYEVTHNRTDVCTSPDDICPLLETVQTGRFAAAEHIHYDRLGNKLYLEISSSPIRDKDGRIIQIAHVSRDITERKIAEKTLRESEEQLKNILDSIQAGIMVVNPRDQTVVSINSFAATLIGASKEKIVGRPIREFLSSPARDRRSVTDRRETADNAGHSLVRADGTRVPVLQSTSRVLYRNEEHLMESFIDISHLMEVEGKLHRLNEQLFRSNEDLQEINEELKNFVYIVSHDLRAPLVNIKGFSEELITAIREIGPLLEKYLDGFAEAERKQFSAVLKKDIPEALNFIGSSVSRMDNLINSILKLSRAGRRKLNPERIRVSEMIQTILNSLAHQLATRRVSVSTGELPEVIADQTALEQIFGNLLDNAVKYLDPKRNGEINIWAEQGGEEVVFHVRDNGRGMAKEDIPQAFEIFRRVGRLNVPGEGMGLAYVKTLVRLHGGRVWCDSKLGVGTTFSFTIPQQRVG